MNWGAIGSISEVVGAIGVIVTLVYLAQQIRQNTEQSRLSSIHQLTTRINLAFDPIYSGENTRVWTKGLTNPDSLSVEDRQVFDLLMNRVIATFDSTTYQYEHGAVPTDLYDGLSKTFQAIVSTPGGSAWYLTNCESFSRETRLRLDASAACSRAVSES